MALVEAEVAGDPVTGELWIQRSVRKLERELHRQGRYLPKSVIQRVLSAAGIHPKSNVKHLTPSPHPDRDRQFRYLVTVRQQAEQRGDPVVSVDTKKKELIGLFAQRGTVWRRRPHEVYSHDFPDDALARIIPYGVYDVVRNEGFVLVGTSHDTADFAVDALVWWWRAFGRRHYPGRTHLLILADGGGSNGHRRRRWKFRLQRDLCEALGLVVTVCHYPTGASKWNPIEHRLFSQISQTWRGLPLTSIDLAMAALRATTTKTGLRVRAKQAAKKYIKDEPVKAWQWEMLRLTRHEVCPLWNDTLTPRKKGKLFWDSSISTDRVRQPAWQVQPSGPKRPRSAGTGQSQIGWTGSPGDGDHAARGGEHAVTQLPGVVRPPAATPTTVVRASRG
jgi:hypothetical protein